LYDDGSINETLPKFTYILERDTKPSGNVLYRKGEIWFFFRFRQSRKVFQYAEKVAFDRGSKCREDFALAAEQFFSPAQTVTNTICFCASAG